MIRHRETGQYYRGAGQWTAEPQEAMHFENLSQVMVEAQQHGLESACEFVIELDGKIGFRARLPL